MAVGLAQSSKQTVLGGAIITGAVFAAGFVLAQSQLNVLENHPNRIIGLETANTYHEGTVEFSVGTFQANDRGGATGNQLYFGGGSYSPSDKLTFGLDLQVYEDPTLEPINGLYPDIRMETVALWGKYKILDTGRLAVSALGSVESIVNIEADIWGGPHQPQELIGALKVPVSFLVTDRLQFHVTPSVSFYPETIAGAQFYGTIASIGTGVSYLASNRLSFFGAIDAPISGGNTIASDGSYKKVPVWTVGGRYNVTPKIALDGYLTNGIGVTPATSVLTFWPEGDEVLAGARLVYTPGAKRQVSYLGVPAQVTRREENLQQDGLILMSADVLEPGKMRIGGWYGSNNNAGVMLGFSPDQDFEVQAIFEQPSDSPSAPSSLIPTTVIRYMIGGKLRFMDQNSGNPFSLGARVLFGRQMDNQPGKGVFFAEAAASFKTASGLTLTANPKASGWGGTRIAGLGLGLNYAVTDGLDLIAEATPVFLDGDKMTWAAGMRYTASSGFSVDANVTNAIGRNSIFSMIGQDDVRVSLMLSKTFDLSGLKRW